MVDTLYFHQAPNVYEVRVILYRTGGSEAVSAQIELLICSEAPTCVPEDIIDILEYSEMTIEKVINENDTEIDVEMIASGNNTGWAPVQITDFFDIRLFKPYYVTQMVVLEGSNVMNYKLQLVTITENGDESLIRLPEHKRVMEEPSHYFFDTSQPYKVLRFQPTRPINALEPYNIKIQLIACMHPPSRVTYTTRTTTNPTTTTTEGTTTTVPTTSTTTGSTTTAAFCDNYHEYTDILLNSLNIEEINNEHDNKIELNTLNTANNSLPGWNKNHSLDLFDIKFSYAIKLDVLKIATESNVTKYDLTVIDEESNSYHFNDIESMIYVIRLNDSFSKIKVIRFIPREPEMAENIKLQIYGCTCNKKPSYKIFI